MSTLANKKLHYWSVNYYHAHTQHAEMFLTKTHVEMTFIVHVQALLRLSTTRLQSWQKHNLKTRLRQYLQEAKDENLPGANSVP